MEMLLFEKIAYLEKTAKGGKGKGKASIPGYIFDIEDEAARSKALEAWHSHHDKKSNGPDFTNIDGSKVNKKQYPGTDWDNLGVRIENTPMAGHYYTNPKTPQQVKHNAFLDGYYSYKPNIFSRAWNAWRDYSREAASDRLFENKLQNAADRHAESMREYAIDRRTNKQINAERHRRSDLQGMGVLGAGGALGGGALLVSNREQQQAPYMSSPMYYEQDYYH